jgi:hypothetical protein
MAKLPLTSLFHRLMTSNQYAHVVLPEKLSRNIRAKQATKSTRVRQPPRNIFMWI